MLTRTQICLFPCLLLFAAALAADDQCVDQGDGQSVEDKACTVAEAPSPPSDELEMLVLPVPGVGHVAVPVFAELNVKVHQHGGQAVTVALWTKAEHPSMEMLWTVFANRSGESYSEREARARLTSLNPALSHPSLPAEAEHWTFETGMGEAQMVSHYAPGKTFAGDEWDTATLALAITPELVAAATILNEGKTSPALKSALKVLNATHVISLEDLPILD